MVQKRAAMGKYYIIHCKSENQFICCKLQEQKALWPEIMCHPPAHCRLSKTNSLWYKTLCAFATRDDLKGRLRVHPHKTVFPEQKCAASLTGLLAGLLVSFGN